jgi:anti-anti-sigma factor
MTNSTCTYTPYGRIDATNAAQCEAELLAMIDQSGPSVLLDLSHLSYVSSAGLRVMLLGAKRSKTAGGKAVIVGAQAAVAEVLRMSGFDRIIPLAEDAAAAQALFSN